MAGMKKKGREPKKTGRKPTGTCPRCGAAWPADIDSAYCGTKTCNQARACPCHRPSHWFKRFAEESKKVDMMLGMEDTTTRLGIATSEIAHAEAERQRKTSNGWMDTANKALGDLAEARADTEKWRVDYDKVSSRCKEAEWKLEDASETIRRQGAEIIGLKEELDQAAMKFAEVAKHYNDAGEAITRAERERAAARAEIEELRASVDREHTVVVGLQARVAVAERRAEEAERARDAAGKEPGSAQVCVWQEVRRSPDEWWSCLTHGITVARSLSPEPPKEPCLRTLERERDQIRSALAQLASCIEIHPVVEGVEPPADDGRKEDDPR